MIRVISSFPGEMLLLVLIHLVLFPLVPRRHQKNISTISISPISVLISSSISSVRIPVALKFLHISDLFSSYKQVVFSAMEAQSRRISIGIIAFLPGFSDFPEKNFQIFLYK